MSGVAALLSLAESPGVSSLATMLQAVPHRGTFSQTVEHGRAALGVVAHSPESPDASLDVADGYAGAVVGLIDNARELERELRSRRSLPPVVSTARLTIELYRAYGPDAANRLRGVFAVVLTDGEQIFCFRDHVGYTSLFFRHDENGTYVASEAKQVVAGSGISKEPDLEVLERIFYQSYDDSTPCALRGVERIPKAAVVSFGRSGSSTSKYWDPAALLETRAVAPADLQDAFDTLMAQAARRMVTEHSSASLSGGIDSPAVVAYAGPAYRELTGRRLPCLTAIYPDHPSVDERRYTEVAAEKLDVSLQQYVPAAPNLDRLGEWMALTDGPVPAISLPYYEEHYRQVRAVGADTVLSGELAEFVADTSAYLLVHLLTHGRLRALASQMRMRRERGHSIAALARPLVTGFAPTALVRWKWRRSATDLPAWLDRARANEAAARSAMPARSRWRALQLGAFTGPGLSAEAEQICQQVCGVQARRPWTDIDLWEFFLGLPAEIKFPDPQRKALVRQLLRGRVPDEILDRKDKTLFNDSIMSSIDYAELGRWLRNPNWRVRGVNYAALNDLVDRRALRLTDFLWAKDLASVHAFLAQW
jgi:asparagine synthase (glutamine-hydrolysing)